MLGYSVLAATLAAYVAVYSTRLHHLPTLFDYTAILDAALPLVFVALGQSLVVLTPLCQPGLGRPPPDNY